MNDPQRLLDGGTTDDELALLRSWQVEQPTEGARAAVMTALAAGGGAVAVAKGGAIAGKGTAAAGAVAAKWVAALFAVAAVGGGVATYAHRASHPRVSVVAPSAETTVTHGAPAPPLAPPVSEHASEPVTEPAPVVAVPQAAAPVKPQLNEVRTKKAARAPQPSLGDQVSAVDSARRALGAGDVPSALAQVDQYEARFHDGVLVEEAEVLRVEALLAEGDRAAATRAGERFLAAHPTSPHAARVRALLTSP